MRIFAIQLGDYDGAIKDFGRRIDLQPNADNYETRGLVRFEYGDYEGAIDDCIKALELDPKKSDARFCLFDAQERLDKQQQQGMETALSECAFNFYNEQIEDNPNDADAYRGRGRARKDLGHTSEGIDDLNQAKLLYNQALRLDESNREAYISRADVRSQLGDYKGAIDDLGQAIRLDPNDANAFVVRGQTHYSEDNFRDAGADFDEALRLNPKNQSATIWSKLVPHRLREQGANATALFTHVDETDLDGAGQHYGFTNVTNPPSDKHEVISMATQTPHRSVLTTPVVSDEEYRSRRLDIIKQVCFWIIVAVAVTTFLLNKFGYETKQDHEGRMVQVDKWTGEMRILYGNSLVIPKTQAQLDADERKEHEDEASLSNSKDWPAFQFEESRGFEDQVNNHLARRKFALQVEDRTN